MPKILRRQQPRSRTAKDSASRSSKQPQPAEKGLHQWLPRLLRVYREFRGQPSGPSDRLTPREAAEIASGVSTLSQGLTRERILAGKTYFSDPVLMGAYLLYFWPISYWQAQGLFRLGPKPGRVLELGSGAGPLSIAALDAGAVEVTLADRHKPALQLAALLARQTVRPVHTQLWNPTARDTIARLPAGRFDWISLQHVLNELWAESSDRLARRVGLIESLTEHLRPGGRLAIIEPALTPTSRDALLLRDHLLTKGWQIVEPCLWTGPCPALARETDSCHDEEPWSPPPLVQDLIRRAGLKRRDVKMTRLILSREPIAPAPRNHFRIVSEPLKSKNGRSRLIACGPPGRMGLALHPNQVTDANRAFLALRRGDRIELSGTTPSEKGLALGLESRIHIVRHHR